MKFEDKIIYQVYPKSFFDTNGDGVGDIRGIIEKLYYFKDLGIDIIWINPIFLSPQKDNGYDVEDYYSIDPLYGSMEDFEKLCIEADKLGIGIMLDMVFNHTSIENKWFRKAISGDKFYEDYYIFKKGKGNNPPTNWKSKFGGEAWQYVKEIDKWYLHLFDKTQADLNWKNPFVRKELENILNFWINKGVKGFRFDVINLIDKIGYNDDENELDGRQYYTDGDKVHNYLTQLNKNSFGKYSDIVTVGEMSSTSIKECVKYSKIGGNELDMTFSFYHLKVDYKNNNKWEIKSFDLIDLKSVLNDWQIKMCENNAWNALFFNNHDQPRAVSRFCDDKKYHYESATMLATLTHMMRGTPYIYQGEEIGMTNACFSDINQYRDVESKNFYNILKNENKTKNEILEILSKRSRDNSRTPMQWKNAKYAGFSRVIPWIEVNKNYPKINVESQINDDNSIYSYYKKLIRLRKNTAAIVLGDYEPIFIDDKEIFAYKRKHEDVTIVVICNFFDICKEIEINSKFELLLGNYNDLIKYDNKLNIRPYEAMIIKVYD